MAWTEQCRIQACDHIKNKKETLGSVRKAIRQVSKESDIPYGTLRRWYYPDSVPKNGNTRSASRKNQPADIRTVTKFKKRKWTNATESLKRINATLLKINGSSSDSLREVPVAVLKNFLKQFSQLQEYADAAEKRVNGRAMKSGRRKAA